MCSLSIPINRTSQFFRELINVLSLIYLSKMLIKFNMYSFIFFKFRENAIMFLEFMINIVDISKSNDVNFFIHIMLIYAT